MACPAQMLKQVVIAIAVSFIAVTLNGCVDIYKETCIWHSDMSIKGCSYYTFRSCIQHCHYCITSNGPDECAQLKCVSYCSKRDEDDCVKNFEPLCRIAVEENFRVEGDRVAYNCDVACNGAVSHWPGKVLWIPFLGFLFGNLPTRHAAIGTLLLFVSSSLYGCCPGPKDPEAQLNWEPDYGDFKKKADWEDDKGVWRGNPTWRFSAELENEDYHCKTIYSPERPICVVWTLHEWNCGEHDFGICKCHKLASKGDYCVEWGCHALEADQQICRRSKNNDGQESQDSEHCTDSYFPMDLNRYIELIELQMRGDLTTGESIQWWDYNAFGHLRRLGEALPDAARIEAEEQIEALVRELDQFKEFANESHKGHVDEKIKLLTSQLELLREWQKSRDRRNAHADADDAHPIMSNDSDIRQLLSYYNTWPPMSAYSTSTRHRYYRWSDVCIVNGDNKALARRHCEQWREIETEISHCHCLEGNEVGACVRWTCEERDVGLFSIIFRTRQSISAYTEGAETEMYECKSFDANKHCTAWEGDIESREEVEWTRCECKPTCNAVDGKWLCDEYELPRTLVWNHPHYNHRYIWFVFFEFVGVCIFCRVFGEGSEDAIPVGVCCSCCVGIILFPFLMVTFGFYAFLAISLPFWICRCLVCSCMFLPAAGQSTLEAIEDVANPKRRPVENHEPVKITSKERFKRGATKIVGIKKGPKVVPEPVGKPEWNVDTPKDTP